MIVPFPQKNRQKNNNNLPAPWHESIIYHPVQHQLVTDNVQFKVVPAGRRSGKTWRAKRKLMKEAFRVPGLYFAGAPTHQQAKKIYWNDLLSYVPHWFELRPPLHSELIIFLSNGSQIHVLGLDKPSRFEGIPWTGGILDEVDDMKEGSLDENILPALDTIEIENGLVQGIGTWMWIIGVPDGLKTLYDKFTYAKSGKDSRWKAYTWKSADILPAKMIQSAKDRMSPKQFLQEYEASFETASGRIYGDYSSKNHTDRTLDSNLPIYWTHDFNFTPLSSAICQKDRNEIVYVVDEIVLESAVAMNTATEFVDRYKDHDNKMVYLHGDASGIAGEKHGKESDYIVIEKHLKNNGFKVKRKAPRKNPAIKDAQNALRARICNANNERRFFVNPSKCKMVDKGLMQVQLKKGSAFQEEDGVEYQHITTALRYMADIEYPVKRNITVVAEV